MAEGKDLALGELLSLLTENGEAEEQVKDTETKDEGIGIEELLSVATLFSELGTEDDRSRLLHAIKPFLGAEKQPKVDTAVKLLKLAKMAEVAGKSDLLKKLKL